MCHPISIAAIFSLSLSLSSCGSSESTTTTASGSKGLIFTGANSQTDTSVASVLRLDPETFATEVLLTAESGDTAIFKSAKDVLLFNRSAGMQNYRILKPENNTVTIGGQNRFASGVLGDPHDALDLGNDTVLLSHYNQGRLTLMKQSSGEEISDIQAEWDLPPGVDLKPEALWRSKVGNRSFIYVIHQAIAYEGLTYTVNGTQTIFVLEQIGSTLVPYDLDSSAAKIQGIKIQGSFPIVVRPRVQSDKVLIVSMCSRFVSPSVANPANVCKNAVEQLDPATQTVSLLWDLDNSGFYMNGSVLAAGSGNNRFFAQVDQKEGSVFTKRIVKFDADTKTSETTYNYEPTSGGYYGYFYDELRNNLLIGDISNETVGKFTVIKNDNTRLLVPLPVVPYSGVFLY